MVLCEDFGLLFVFPGTSSLSLPTLLALSGISNCTFSELRNWTKDTLNSHGRGCTMQSIFLKSLQFYGVGLFIGSFLDLDYWSVMLHSSRTAILIILTTVV